MARSTLSDLSTELNLDLRVPWFDVTARQFAGGALLDGSNDDLAAYQSAIDLASLKGGGRVLVPSSTSASMLSGQIVMKANVWLQGCGANQTTLKLLNASNASMIANSGATDHIKVSDLTLDGNKANQTTGAHGIVLVLATKATIRDVRVVNTFNNGIFLFTCTDSLITNCEVESTGKTATTDLTGAGIRIATTCLRTRVIGNRVEGCNDAGICLSGNPGNSVGVVIEGNTVKDTGANIPGIALGTLNSVITLSNNFVIEPTNQNTHCLDTGSCTDVSVVGNVCTGGEVGTSTDLTSGGGRRSIIGNTYVNQNLAGLNFTSGAGATLDATVVGNTISGAGGDGMYFDSVLNGLVANNTIKNCSKTTGGTKSGINFYSTFANPTGFSLIGNRCYDDQGGKTQQYGIRLIAGNDSFNIQGNDLRGNLTAGLLVAGTNHVIGDNVGVRVRAVKTLAYSGTIATDASLGDVFPIVATNGTAFTISNPTNLLTDMILTYDIKNSSGGAIGAITWGATFLNGGAGTVGTGAFAGIANGKRRTISFYYDGTNLIELFRTADI